jgi:hypothetical protein
MSQVAEKVSVVLQQATAQAALVVGRLETDITEFGETYRRGEEFQYAVDVQEAITMANVCNEINELGKPRFGNEKARDAEVTLRLSENADYQNNRKEALNHKAQLKEKEYRLKMNFESLRMQRSVVETINAFASLEPSL